MTITPDSLRRLADGLANQNSEAERVAARYAASADMLEALLAVREACFFEDDNGIGVSEDVVIDSDLFDAICRAIKASEEQP